MSELDSQALLYSEDFLGFDLRMIESAYKRFRPFFKGEVCFEVGCSVGHMTAKLSKDFKRVVALDGSKLALAQMQDRQNVEKVCCLIEEFDSLESYPTIIANHFLEHVKNPVDVLRKLKGLLDPEGVLIVGVPNAKSWHRLAGVKMGLLRSEYELNDRDVLLGHERVYDAQMLGTDIQAAGLRIVDSGGLLMKFLPNSMMMDLPEQVIKAYEVLVQDFPENGAEIFAVCHS